MAGKRINIMDLRQLITLKRQGLSNRKVAKILRISRTTVNDYVRRFEALSFSYDVLLSFDDGKLEQLHAPESEISQERYKQLASYFDYFLKELKKPGCTLLTLWHEYKERHRNGYAYTQFTRHYRLWAKNQQGSVKLNHKAGEKVFVDYTGKKLQFIDKSSGTNIAVEVFVAILPCSQYTYVEASLSQKREDFISCMQHCLEFFGGVPLAIISDNLKSAVTKGCKYEPIINKTFKEFAVHYDCVIDPTRPYSPQDKALVESAVNLVYQRIFYPLSKTTFFSLQELNKAIADLLVKYNQILFQQRQYSRRELFVSSEKNLLRALPPTPYEIRNYKRATVQKMGYVWLSEDKHYYSVPYQYIGQRVEVSYSQSSVEVFYKHQRLCSHKRNKLRPGQYTTEPGHLSSAHKAHSDWNLDFFQRKAKLIGPYTLQYITKLILQYSYPEVGYKQSQGIIHLGRFYDKSRIEKACQHALGITHCSYRTIENILESGIDQLELFTGEVDNHIPSHENVRGESYYQ